MINDFEPFPQGTLVTNHNLLVKALVKINIKLEESDKKGMCYGLHAVHLLHAIENRREEFFILLEFLSLLKTEGAINRLIADYQKNKGTNKELLVAAKKGQPPIKFSKFIQFLKAIKDAQKLQSYKSIGANWDRSFNIFCDKNQLSENLKRANISLSTLMSVSLGDHVFSMEKTPKGFYVFEPNSIKKPTILPIEDDVAAEISENLIPYFAEETLFSKANNNIAMSISFLSYGDKNRELDDLIQQFETANKTPYPDLDSLISQYRAGKMSRLDLALILDDKIKKLRDRNNNNIEKEIEFFHENIKKYISDNKIFDDSDYTPDMQVRENTINSSASHRLYTSLYMASHANRIMLVKKLLEKNAYPVLSCGSHSSNALHISANKGFTEIVKLLLTKELAFSWDRHGRTPLHDAVFAKQTEVIEIFFSAGIHPDITSRSKNTPLHEAVVDGEIEMVKLLLLFKANPNQQNQDGITPFHYALIYGHIELVKILADDRNVHSLWRFSFEYRGEYQLTALHIATLFLCKEIIDFLTQKGVDTSANIYGLDPKNPYGINLKQIEELPRFSANGLSLNSDRVYIMQRIDYLKDLLCPPQSKKEKTISYSSWCNFFNSDKTNTAPQAPTTTYGN